MNELLQKTPKRKSAKKPIKEQIEGEFIITRTFYHRPILARTVVNNVYKNNKTGMYHFTIKATGKKSQLFYGWAFVKNNESSINLLDRRDAVREKIDLLTEQDRAITKKLDTLPHIGESF